MFIYAPFNGGLPGFTKPERVRPVRAEAGGLCLIRINYASWTDWFNNVQTQLFKSSWRSAEPAVPLWRLNERWIGWDTGLKKTLHASEQEREDIRQLREQWIDELPFLDPAHLVFIDESGAKTNMTRLRGRARHGRRLFARAPYGHWCTTTMISSIRLDGTTAAMEIDGATDSAVFRTYVRYVLIPTLGPKDIVVMDNLRAHYDSEAIEMIEAAGASVRFLPPYSPDFNPIEKMWSKIKNLLRGLAARTQQELSDAITQAFDSVTADDAKGWFSSCYITALNL